MKQLTDAELKEVAVNLLDKQGLEQYEQSITEHEQKMKQDPQANGFHNTPVECENFECRNCTMHDVDRQDIDCPYMDVV